MIALIKAIRSTILDSTTLSYLDGRIYIAPETNSVTFFPESYDCPCVILSDAGEEIEWFPDTNKDSRLSVAISSFVYLREPESALIGVDTQKGVLDISKDLQTLLVHNLLSLTGYIDAFVRTVDRTVPFSIPSQEDLAIKQTMIMEYRRDG